MTNSTNLIDLDEIGKKTEEAVSELLEVSGIGEGDILAVGCSSSEITGGTIGKNSSFEAAKAVFDALYRVLSARKIYLAAQCCEHLNRALIVEKECASKYGLEPVSVIPWPHAGGSFATAAYMNFKDPVAVEHIRAHAGMDIGDTIIGMHLKDVAVPVRLKVKKIGEANLVAARTRPKYIGGERAHYTKYEGK